MARPTFEPIWLSCKGCGHAWDDWQPNYVPVDTWISYVKSYRCPKCNATYGILIRMKPLTEETE